MYQVNEWGSSKHGILVFFCPLHHNWCMSLESCFLYVTIVVLYLRVISVDIDIAAWAELCEDREGLGLLGPSLLVYLFMISWLFSGKKIISARSFNVFLEKKIVSSLYINFSSSATKHHLKLKRWSHVWTFIFSSSLIT